MLDTTDSLSLLAIAEIVGPILLGGALVYGIFHTRRRRSQMPKDTKGTVYAQDR